MMVRRQHHRVRVLPWYDTLIAGVRCSYLQVPISDHGYFAVPPATCAWSFEPPGYYDYYRPALSEHHYYHQQQQDHYQQQAHQQHVLVHQQQQQVRYYQQQQQQQAVELFALKRLVQIRERSCLRERRGRQCAMGKVKKLKAKVNVLKVSGNVYFSV